MDIIISGIPKGLDPTSVTKYIKRSVETVAQVNSIWVSSDKGYGAISLFDATSTDCVLALNNRKHVKRDTRYLKPSHIRNPRCHVQSQCLSPRSDDSYCINAGTSQLSEQKRLGAYITYKSYHRDQPCTETLYNILQQNPPRRKTQKLKRPRKDISIHTTTPAPAASRKSGRIRKRHRKKRKESRSPEIRGSSRKKRYTSERDINISNTEKDKKKHIQMIL
ncbi:uncharacterized protein [Argopecten irradians]|uniref:uncharacterized protein isoform X2 n=1 Tax=Argopecten irradians TaxID=31199 RepID=UPI003724020F